MVMHLPFSQKGRPTVGCTVPSNSFVESKTPHKRYKKPRSQERSVPRTCFIFANRPLSPSTEYFLPPPREPPRPPKASLITSSSDTSVTRWSSSFTHLAPSASPIPVCDNAPEPWPVDPEGAAFTWRTYA